MNSCSHALHLAIVKLRMSNEKLYIIILLIPMSLIVSGIIQGLKLYPKLGVNQRLIVLALVIAALTEILSRVFLSLGIRNYVIYHFYVPLSYTIYSGCFRSTFRELWSRLIKRSIVLIWGLAIANLIWLQGFQELNTNITVLTSTFLVCMCIGLFFKMLNEMLYQRVEKSSMFWINIGLMVYYSSSLLLFAFSGWISELALEFSVGVWILHLFFNFIHYLCFNIALWMDPE